MNRRDRVKASFVLGRVAGIPIGIHYTWLFAFTFFSWSLAERFFPDYFPGWHTATYWATGFLAALLLFTSVLVHELAHSVVARAIGLPVQSITLFVFGGVSNLGSEAQRAKDEFAIAIVGPLTSLALAVASWAMLQGLGGNDGPVEAILWYVLLINALLAVFNLLPGLPLDGGRVLRSLVWGTTGSLPRATNIAARTGQALGWILVALGVVQIVSGNVVGGLWTGFVGWFLSQAATASRYERRLRDQLMEVQVRQVMDSAPVTVDSHAPLDQLASQQFRQSVIAVTENGRPVGTVSVSDLREIPEELWPSRRVVDIMAHEVPHSVGPADAVNVALELLGEHGLDEVFVVEDGRPVGVLSRADVTRYLQQGGGE